MKHSYLLIALILAGFLTGKSHISHAQIQQSNIISPVSERVFQDALSHYRAFNFDRAQEIFKEVDNIPEAILLRGNSLFALARYEEAKEVLLNAAQLPFDDLSQEATYSLALTHLALRNFTDGLKLLIELESSPFETLGERSSALFEEYNAFLSVNQRNKLLSQSDIDHNLQFRLIQGGIVYHDYDNARAFLNLAERSRLKREDILSLRQLFNETSFSVEETEAGELTESVAELVYGKNELTEKDSEISLPFPQVKAPQGFVYRIGVVLPQQKRDAEGYEVSRNIYYGLLMSIEGYNQSQNNTRIVLRLFETDTNEAYEGSNENYFDEKIEEWIEKEKPDVIIGPLFSEDARKLANAAAITQTPVIAPLANSEDLSADNPFFFHANPTFEARGRRMAELATQYLGHLRISILVDQNSLGAIEAEAFRKRAIELGAEIPYFFKTNLQARRFDMAEFSRYFTSDPKLLNLEEDELEEFTKTWKESDALFLPVSGSAAPTVIDLMMTQLLALRSNVQVIGSQEFGMARINPQAARRFRVMYSEVFYREDSSSEIMDFNSIYRSEFGRSPDLFSFVGFDLGNFIASNFDFSSNPEYFKEGLKVHPRFRGLGQQFDFAGGQINSAILPLQFTDGRFRIREFPNEPVYDLFELRAEEEEERLRELEEEAGIEPQY